MEILKAARERPGVAITVGLALVAGIAGAVLWIRAMDAAFYITDDNWERGVSRKWAGYYVPADSPGHQAGRVVALANGQTRTIVRTQTNGPYLNVFVSGDLLSYSVHGLPRDYKTADPSPGTPPSDTFFLTDSNWQGGVARRWAGFFVRAGTPGYAAGRQITLKNGEARKITRVQEHGPYLHVYVDGDPLDSRVHGFPPDFVLK